MQQLQQQQIPLQHNFQQLPQPEQQTPPPPPPPQQSMISHSLGNHFQNTSAANLHFSYAPPGLPSVNGAYHHHDIHHTHYIPPYNYASLPLRRHSYRGGVDNGGQSISPGREASVFTPSHCHEHSHLAVPSYQAMSFVHSAFQHSYAVAPHAVLTRSLMGTGGFVVPVYGQQSAHLLGYNNHGLPMSASGFIGMDSMIQQCLSWDGSTPDGRTSKSGQAHGYIGASSSNSEDEVDPLHVYEQNHLHSYN